MSVDFTAYFSATETLFASQNPIVNLDFAPKSDERLLLISSTTRVLVVDLSSPAGSTLQLVGPAFSSGKTACGACFGFKQHRYAIFSPRNRSLHTADSDTALDRSQQTQWQPCDYTSIPTVEGDSRDTPLLHQRGSTRSPNQAATNMCFLSRFRGGLEAQDALLLNVVYIPAPASGGGKVCHWTLLRVQSLKPLRTQFVLANRDLGPDLVFMSVCEDTVGSTIFAVAADAAGVTRLAKITAHSSRALVRSVGRGKLYRSLQVVMCHRVRDLKVLPILLNLLCKKLRLLLSKPDSSEATAAHTPPAPTPAQPTPASRPTKPNSFEVLFLGKKKSSASSPVKQPAWMSGDLSLVWGDGLGDWCALASAFAAFCAGTDGLSVLVESLNDFVRQAQAIVPPPQQQQQEPQQEQQKQQPALQAEVTPVKTVSTAPRLTGTWLPVSLFVLFECECCHVQHRSRNWCGSGHRGHQPSCQRYVKDFGYDLNADVCVDNAAAADDSSTATPTQTAPETTELFRCRYCAIEHPSKTFCASTHRDHLPDCERYSAQHRFDVVLGRALAVKPTSRAAEANATAGGTAASRWHLTWGAKGGGKYVCGYCGVAHPHKAFCTSRHQGGCG